MVSDKIGDAIFYAVLLILPLSALAARRLAFGATVKMAFAWISIFALALLLVGQRERLRPTLTTIRDALFGREQIVSGQTVRIAMADDGHFWADVSINGVRRRMLVDSGATTTALSVGTAKAAGLDLDESPFTEVLDTANGQISAKVSTAKQLVLGGIVAHDLPVVVAPEFGDGDVIGMNFLSRLAAWQVEGRILVLIPKQ